MEKRLEVLTVVIYLYMIIAHFCVLYFWYQWYQCHGFLSTVFIGPIVSEIKGLLCPFFLQLMEYTYEDLLKQCEIVKDLIKEGKNRRSLDRRNYIIALMYYKFNKTEFIIAKAFDMKRETVTSAKFHPYQLLDYGDISFIANVNDLILEFPFEFPDHKALNAEKRYTAVIVHFDQETKKKIRSYMDFKNISRIDMAVKELTTKALKLWEE